MMGGGDYMNIGGIAPNMNPYLGAAKTANKTQSGSFKNAMNNVSSTGKTIQLHGSVDCDGNKVIGAWGDAVAGTSTTVYKPADFDPNEPKYLMRIWDDDNNLLEEREVDISELDIKNCDTFDLYAYACHLSDSKEYPDALNKFLMMPTQNNNSFSADYDISNLYEKKNWFKVIKDFMDMQYGAGNIQGYLDFKKFYDFLLEK